MCLTPDSHVHVCNHTYAAGPQMLLFVGCHDRKAGPSHEVHATCCIPGSASTFLNKKKIIAARAPSWHGPKNTGPSLGLATANWCAIVKQATDCFRNKCALGTWWHTGEPGNEPGH
jgi:hypothetical protein